MKSKKFIAILLGVICAVLMSYAPSFNVRAETLDEADQYFVDFVLSDTGLDAELEYSHTPLYNHLLTAHGRHYTFTVNNRTGYALMVEIPGLNDTVMYEIEELRYDVPSPFANCNGLPVYITHRVYLYYNNGEFRNIQNDVVVPQTTIEDLVNKGFGYCGAAVFTDHTTTVSYSTKSETRDKIMYNLPDYSSTAGTSCANVAGAIAIGYYDRFYTNLIPNFTPYITMGGVVIYKSPTIEIQNLTLELANLMNTDGNQEGTTFSGFQSGMESYVEGKGYTYSSTNIFSWGSFNFNNYKSAIENGKPVVIFLSSFAFLADITENQGADTIDSYYCANTHVVVGYGYMKHTYYNANGGTVDTRTYLQVASGLDSFGLAYLNINGLGNMDRAISITIS